MTYTEAFAERFGTEYDPRHGTVAGYNRIPCREDCCRLAMARYKKRWAWDRDNGRSRIVSTLGTRRRVQALAALGWSQGQVAARAGVYAPNMARLIAGETMTRTVADRIAAVYDELSMRLPTGSAQAIANVRNRAQRMGWPPPLAWDDPDDPNEAPHVGRNVHSHDDVDPVVVDRFMSGEWGIPTTKAEKFEIAARWTAWGRSLASLEVATGWRAERYVNQQDGAA